MADARKRKHAHLQAPLVALAKLPAEPELLAEPWEPEASASAVAAAAEAGAAEKKKKKHKHHKKHKKHRRREGEWLDSDLVYRLLGVKSYGVLWWFVYICWGCTHEVRVSLTKDKAEPRPCHSKRAHAIFDKAYADCLRDTVQTAQGLM